MPKPLHVFVIGAGGVGKVFLTQLKALAQRHSNITLAAITTSRRSVSATDAGLPADQKDWLDISTAPEKAALSVSDVLALARKVPAPGRAVMVDNTSNQGVAESYPSFLREGVSVVTANKKAFSGSWQLWREVQDAAWEPSSRPSNGLLYYESACGAGLPVISTLTDLVATGDRVTRIEGVFSGTMSFLFNSFAPLAGAGGRWSAEVANAKALGYTEPDPRDDLNGLDVARKLVILARLAGLDVQDTAAFPVQSLIPAELESVASGDEFLQKLPGFDDRMDAIKAEAARDGGKVVRFVGSIDVAKAQLKVGLETFAPDHPIAALKGADNIISFHSQRYANSPLIVQGAGAGADVTAMGVTADLIRVLQRIDSIQ